MKKFILPVIFVVLGLSSCDFLERTPKDKLAPENYFRNEQDLKLFSNSFYDNLFEEKRFDTKYTPTALCLNMCKGRKRDGRICL